MEFEKKLQRLEEIVKKMEAGDIALEESLQLFEEGVRLSKQCHEQLGQAEQKVKILSGISPSGEAQLEDFKTQAQE